eukprot:GHVN01073333.1.p1 GENE.GHVN01073333.1~~GHVN01073333.1.p1  ORF type:complete len:172 (+),score=2.30 GHVN01073333.1:412-927(+)
MAFGFRFPPQGARHWKNDCKEVQYAQISQSTDYETRKEGREHLWGENENWVVQHRFVQGSYLATFHAFCIHQIAMEFDDLCRTAVLVQVINILGDYFLEVPAFLQCRQSEVAAVWLRIVLLRVDKNLLITITTCKKSRSSSQIFSGCRLYPQIVAYVIGSYLAKEKHPTHF